MMLHHKVKIHKVIVHVVQQVDLSRLAHEKQRRRTGKHLNVAAVRRKSRNEHVGEPQLAAYPRNDRHRH
jgi:hypothetical protein